MATTTSVQKAARPRISRRLREDLRAYLFVSPWILSLLAFTAYPTLASFYFALTRYTIVNPPEWVGLANFQQMLFADPLFWKAVANTVYYTVVSVPLSLAVALGLAVLLNQGVSGIGVYRTVFYLPTLVPGIASALIWMVILDPRAGLLNTILDAAGLPRLGWFRSDEWAMPGVILMSLWTGTGSAMLIFLAGLKDTPQSLLDAAKIDGASGIQQFRHVTLPLLTPTIFFNLIMGMIGSFQVFGQMLVVAGTGGTAGPLNSLLVYMLLLYRNAFSFFNMGYASAMALALFIVLVLLTLTVVRSSRYWVHYEGDQRA